MKKFLMMILMCLVLTGVAMTGPAYAKTSGGDYVPSVEQDEPLDEEPATDPDNKLPNDDDDDQMMADTADEDDDGGPMLVDEWNPDEAAPQTGEAFPVIPVVCAAFFAVAAVCFFVVAARKSEEEDEQ